LSILKTVFISIIRAIIYCDKLVNKRKRYNGVAVKLPVLPWRQAKAGCQEQECSNEKPKPTCPPELFSEGG